MPLSFWPFCWPPAQLFQDPAEAVLVGHPQPEVHQAAVLGQARPGATPADAQGAPEHAAQPARPGSLGTLVPIHGRTERSFVLTTVRPPEPQPTPPLQGRQRLELRLDHLLPMAPRKWGRSRQRLTPQLQMREYERVPLRVPHAHVTVRVALH